MRSQSFLEYFFPLFSDGIQDVSRKEKQTWIHHLQFCLTKQIIPVPHQVGENEFNAGFNKPGGSRSHQAGTRQLEEGRSACAYQSQAEIHRPPSMAPQPACPSRPLTTLNLFHTSGRESRLQTEHEICSTPSPVQAWEAGRPRHEVHGGYTATVPRTHKKDPGIRLQALQGCHP